MSLFILQNQDKYFLTKDNLWEDGRDQRRLFKTKLKDEAVNQLFEANAKNVTLRISILECEASDKGLPMIDASELPPLALETQPELADYPPENMTDNLAPDSSQPEPATISG